MNLRPTVLKSERKVFVESVAMHVAGNGAADATHPPTHALSELESPPEATTKRKYRVIGVAGGAADGVV